MIEQKISIEGEHGGTVSRDEIYFSAQRNWGLGRKAVDGIFSVMLSFKRLEMDDYNIWFPIPQARKVRK